MAKHSEQRGKDSSGLIVNAENGYIIHRANEAITSLLSNVDIAETGFVVGHSRLITNGLSDNQPVYRDGIAVVHNGIVVNHEELWMGTGKLRSQEIDTEIIAAIAAQYLEEGGQIEELSNHLFDTCVGVVACALVLPKFGKLCLLSNNGSLYYGVKNGSHYFSSEQYPLLKLGCERIEQVKEQIKIIDIPVVL